MSSKDPSEIKKVLVANPFGIGDVIFSMVLVEALKKQLPGASVDFICNERTADLVSMNPSISRPFVFNRDHFRSLWPAKPVLFFKAVTALLSAVGKEHYDALFDLSLGREFGFFAMALGINRRIGFDHKGRGIFLTHKTKIAGYEGSPVADLQLGLLRYLNLEPSAGKGRLPLRIGKEAETKARDVLKSLGISSEDKIIALAPGGGKSWGPNAIFKQWDPGRFAEAINRFSKSHSRPIVVLGAKEEQSLLEETTKQITGKTASLVGEPFDVVCAMLRRSEFLLCNDGGLLHLANALGVKTVSIFGPVDEKVYGPYGSDTAHEVVTEGVPCRPCYKKFHFPPCPYQRRCLDELQVEKVLLAIEKIV